jgi:hypothetical protein
MKIISNVRVGKPAVTPDKPSHTKGVNEGNKPGGMKKEAGLKPEGDRGKGSARRSTGINPKAHNAIDPRMPNLSPP